MSADEPDAEDDRDPFVRVAERLFAGQRPSDKDHYIPCEDLEIHRSKLSPQYLLIVGNAEDGDGAEMVDLIAPHRFASMQGLAKHLRQAHHQVQPDDELPENDGERREIQ